MDVRFGGLSVTHVINEIFSKDSATEDFELQRLICQTLRLRSKLSILEYKREAIELRDSEEGPERRSVIHKKHNCTLILQNEMYQLLDYSMSSTSAHIEY